MRNLKQFKCIKNIISQFDKNNSYKFSLSIISFMDSDIYKLTDLYTKSVLFHQNPNLINCVDLQQKIVKINRTQNIPFTKNIILDHEYIDGQGIFDDIMSQKPFYIDLKTQEHEQFGFIQNKSDIIFLG